MSVTKKERIAEVRDGVQVVKTAEVKQKVEDDNTEQIAAAFRQWLREQT